MRMADPAESPRADPTLTITTPVSPVKPRGSLSRRIEAHLLGNRTPPERLKKAVCLIRAERLSKVKLLWLVNQDSADHAARPGGEAFDPLDGFPLLDESEARLHLATALSMVAQAIGIMAPSQAACSTRFFSSFISTLIHQLDKGTSWDSISRFYQAVVARIEEPISSFSPFNAEVEATLAPNLAVPPSSSHLLCPGLGLFPRAFLLDLDVKILHELERQFLPSHLSSASHLTPARPILRREGTHLLQHMPPGGSMATKATVLPLMGAVTGAPYWAFQNAFRTPTRTSRTPFHTNEALTTTPQSTQTTALHRPGAPVARTVPSVIPSASAFARRRILRPCVCDECLRSLACTHRRCKGCP
jgi:hypothetical protein